VIATRRDAARLMARYVACGGVVSAHGVVRFGGGAVDIAGTAELPAMLAEGDLPAEAWFAALRMEFDGRVSLLRAHGVKVSLPRPSAPASPWTCGRH
jgi:hypothetical protein